MMRGALAGLFALALAGCGEADEAAAPQPEPTSFDFRLADRMIDPPKDICSARDADFLSNLMQRIRTKLPIPQQSTMTFHDFNVSDQKEATLRFKVDRDGKAGVMMYATGPFDPGNCAVGAMRVGAGASAYAVAGSDEFTVK